MFERIRHWTSAHRTGGSAAILVLLSLLVYGNSFPGAFIVDDLSRVVENPLVASLDLVGIFTTDYWGVDSNSGLFRPLTILSLGINHALLGEGVCGYHLVNVLLHALCVVLLYTVAVRLLPSELALLAAALFAVHPLHTEVVNVVVGRSELLAAVFVLLAIWLHLTRVKGAPTLTALCYLLGLWSKEHAIVLPALLLVLDLYDHDRLRELLRQRWLSYAFLLGVALFWLAERSWWVVQRTSIPPDAPDRVMTPLHFLAPLPRLLTALKLQFLYVTKLFVPLRLNFHYGGRFVDPVGTSDYLWLTILASGLGLLCWYLVVAWRKRRLTAHFLLCYLVSVAPTANLFILTGVSFAERLSFLPSVWFCCTLAAAAHDYLGSDKQRLRTAIIVGLLVCALWGGRALERNRDFRDPLTLARVDVVQQSDNPVAWLSLADALERGGKREQALQALQQAVDLAPKFQMGLSRYAEVLLAAGRLEEALVFAEKALSAQQGTTFPPAHLTAAQAAVRLQRYGLALDHLQAIHRQFDAYGVYWETLGRALEGQGDRLGALQAYLRERAVYFPSESDVQLRIARILHHLGRIDDAEQLLRDEQARRDSVAPIHKAGQ